MSLHPPSRWAVCGQSRQWRLPDTGLRQPEHTRPRSACRPPRCGWDWGGAPVGACLGPRRESGQGIYPLTCPLTAPGCLLGVPGLRGVGGRPQGRAGV